MKLLDIWNTGKEPDESGVAPYLIDKESFVEYLEGIDIIGNSYHHGSALESQSAQILERDRVLRESGADYSLCDILAEWLTKHQNPKTGLWIEGDEVDYMGVNGLLKISSTYSRIGKPVPNATLALDSAMKAISFDEEPGTVCFTLNPWYAIVVITANILKYSAGDEEATRRVAEFKNHLFDNYPALIRKTTANMAKFKKPDGSFSYLQNRTAACSQGMPVALMNENEGDVNATSISIMGISSHVMERVGLPYAVPLYTKADWIKYRSILDGLGAVIKDETKEVEPLDFEDGAVPPEFNPDLNSVGAAVTVVEDEVYGEPSQVVLFSSKTHPTDSDEVEIFLTARAADYNAFAFESDIKIVNHGESNAAYDFNFCASGDLAYVFQLYAFNEYSGAGSWQSDSIYFSHSGDKYQIRVANINEYFRLRCEYILTDYDYTGDGAADILVRIFVDGSLVAMGHTPYRAGSLWSADDLNKFELRALRGSDSDLYMDNLVVEQALIELEPGEINFAAGMVPEVIPNLSSTGSASVSDGKLTLKSGAEGADGLKIYPTLRQKSANTIALETDLSLTAPEDASSVLELAMLSGTATVYGFKIIVTGDEYAGTDLDAGSVYLVGTKDSFKVKVGEQGKKLRLRAEYMNPGLDYTADGNADILVRLYVDGKLVAKGYTPVSELNMPKPAAITAFTLVSPKDSELTATLDNLKLEQCTTVADEGDKVAGADDKLAPTIKDFSNGYTFEDGKIPEGVKTASGNKSGVIRNNVNGESSMVYAVAMTTGRGETVFALNKSDKNADTLIFEAKMKFNCTIQSNGIEFWLGDAYRFDFLVYDSDDETYAQKNGANAGAVKIGRAGGSQITGCKLANEGEWFTFKVEYTVTDTQRIVNIYVNGDRVDGETTAGSFSLDGITTAKFLTYSTVSTDSYFDDLKLTLVNAIEDTPDEPDEPDEPDTPDEPDEPDEPDVPEYEAPTVENSPYPEDTVGGWTPRR